MRLKLISQTMPETQDRLEALQAKLQAETDFLKQMEIQSEIDDIKISSGAMVVFHRPEDSPFECFGCGS